MLICKLHLWKMVSENKRHEFGFFHQIWAKLDDTLILEFFARQPNLANFGSKWWQLNKVLNWSVNIGHKMVFITLFLNRKTKNVKKSILMPLIFANYGRWLNIGKVAFPGGFVESLPGLLNINRLSLSHLELSQSRFKVAKLPLW